MPPHDPSGKPALRDQKNLEGWMARRQESLLGLAAAVALLLAVQIGPWWYPTVDASSYLSMARGVAQGEGLANLGSRHLWYAPGYSLLISPLFWFSDRPFTALLIVQWLLALGCLAGIWRWARQTIPEIAGWIAVAGLTNAAVWFFYRRTLSEMAFTCLFFAFLGTVDDFLKEGDSKAGKVREGRRRWSLVLAGLLAGSMCFTRPAGIALVAGACFAAILGAVRGRYSWQRAMASSLTTGAIGLATVAALVVREQVTARQSGGETYLHLFASAAGTYTKSYLDGLHILITDVGRVVIPFMFKCYSTPGQWRDINLVAYVPLSLLLAWGWWRWVRREPAPAAWTLPFYSAMCVVYAQNSAGRFIVPVLPPLLVCLWYSLPRLRDVRLAILGGVLALHVLAGMSYWLAVDLPATRQLNREWPAVDQIAEEIRRDPAPVFTRRAVADEALLLQFSLDRPVIALATDQDNLVAGAWLLTRAGARPSGLVHRLDAGRLSLWRKP